MIKTNLGGIYIFELSKTKLPYVSIIILNWNGWKDTIECMESLYQIDYPNYNVILVDNDSEDGSIEKIKDYCSGNLTVTSNFVNYDIKNKPVHVFEMSDILEDKKGFFALPSNKKIILIKNDKNYGFAEGNNIGIRFTLENTNPDYILLLNNDTVVDDKFLLEMVKVGEKKKENGIMGPKVYYYDHKDNFQVTTVNLNFKTGKSFINGINEKDEGQYDKISYTDYAPGSCFLVKKSVFENLGLLESNYFCYWEEVEFSVRAKKNGYFSLYVPQAKIWHKVSKTSNKVTGFFNYYHTRNMFWFMKQYSNHYSYFLLYFLTIRFSHQLIYYLFLENKLKLIKCYFKGIKEGLL